MRLFTVTWLYFINFKSLELFKKPVTKNGANKCLNFEYSIQVEKEFTYSPTKKD